MGPTKKSRVVNKCLSKANEEWPDNDGTSTNNRKIRKRKLSDVLGSRWSKEDLERFYEAYRTYGKNWKKVAAVIHSRSIDMVEALYNMNRAYLSLPEGTTTAAGLVAMMTDHYNILDGSDNDRDSNQVSKASHKPQKRGRGTPQRDMPKGYEGPHTDYLQKQSAVSSSGCLPLLKNRFGDLFGGNWPRAVGKRTPRFPVPFSHDNNEINNIISPKRHDLDFREDAAADEGVHGAVLALAEASQRGRPSQISETCDRKAECVRSSPMWSGKTGLAEPVMTNPDYNSVGIDGKSVRGSLESIEAHNGGFTSDAGLSDIEGTGASKIQRKVKKLQKKKSKGPGIQNYQSDDAREACSGAEEGHDVRHVKHEIDTEVRKQKTAIGLQGPRKKSHKLFSPDESCALDALQALADLSVKILLPDSASKSQSSKHANEQKRSVDSAITSNTPGSMSAKQESDKSRISVIKDRGYSSDVGVHVVHQKSVHKNLSPDENSIFEARKTDYPSISEKSKRKRKGPAEMVSVEEGKTSSGGQLVPLAKQRKNIQTPGCLSLNIDLGRGVTGLAESTPQVLAANHPSIPTRTGNRRKISLQKAMAQRKCRFSDGVRDQGHSKCSHFANSKAADLKGKLSHCLSLQCLRRWCAFEWFYGAIDYPWFARSEYVEYLNYVRLGHVPKLTRCEWSIVRSSLGKPRRLSEQFLLEEREKLNQYRESVRTYYDELRAGVREGLPADLARPLSVGQHVIARHPRKGEIHDGRILTVDRDRCRVQFDRPDLGVEFVMDIDCMPLNPRENMPEDLRKQNGAGYHLCNNFTGKKPDGHIMELKDSSAKFSPKKSLEIANGTSTMASTKYPWIVLNEQAKGDMKDANAPGKYSASEVAAVAQHMICNQPCTSAQIQEREADIRALAELTCALKKKEALLTELREMNEEVAGKKEDGDSERGLEHFRKQYAMVFLQLQEASDQASSFWTLSPDTFDLSQCLFSLFLFFLLRPLDRIMENCHNFQVSSALLVLRQRNTFRGISASPLDRSMGDSGLAGCSGTFSTYDLYNHETGSHVAEIVENSMSKARKMVDVAVQAMSSLRDGEDALTCIGEALESKNNQCFVTESGKSRIRYIPHPGNGNSQNQAISRILQPATTHALSPLVQFSPADVPQIPSELISSCVATLLMIQACTTRQYPPAEVAQILEYAVTSLQPCCSQNLPIYREIEAYMGFIKNQMLALIPSLSTSFCPEVSV